MRIRRAGWALVAGGTVAAVVAGGVGTAEAAPTTTLVSRNAAGQAGNGHSFFPSITSDGRFVVFRSTSTNLVPGHSTVREVYLLDRVSGHGLEVVSVADDGSPSNGHSGSVTQASRGGLYVVFDSLGSNLVPGDTNSTFDVFVRMRFAGRPRTERESVSTRGEQADGASFAQGISGDGRLVLFASDATNLVAGDTNKVTDLFVRDRAYGMTTRVNVSSTGEQANNYAADAKITPSGRYVVFRSPATNLVPGDTNSAEDVFLRDRFTGRTERVSVDSTGAQLPGGGSSPSISADGRYVAFESTATNLAAASGQQIYLRDLQAGKTTLASVSRPGNAVSFFPGVTDTGEAVFQSLAGSATYQVYLRGA